MISTAIITAPRPRATVAESLASYRAAGFGGVDTLVFADGEPAPFDLEPRTYLHANKYPLGNLRNWNHALRTLFATHASPWLMVCEDDITWAQGAFAVLVRDLFTMSVESLQNVGALSLYAPRRMTKAVDPLGAGWHSDGLQYGRKAWGAQCFLFSRAMVRQLLTDQQWIDTIENKVNDKNVDGWVAKCINDRGRVIRYRVPCLVDHTLGDGNSSLGYKPDRPDLRTLYFKSVAA